MTGPVRPVGPAGPVVPMVPERFGGDSRNCRSGPVRPQSCLETPIRHYYYLAGMQWCQSCLSCPPLRDGGVTAEVTRTTSSSLGLGAWLALNEAVPALAALDLDPSMLRVTTITSTPTGSSPLRLDAGSTGVLDSRRSGDIAVTRRPDLHRYGCHLTSGQQVDITDDRGSLVPASSSAVTDHRNDLAEHLTVTQDQHVKVLVSGSLLPGCYRAGVGRSRSDGGWSQGAICSKRSNPSNALSHQNPAPTYQPQRSPMSCPTCQYAHAHAAWPPDHRGTHCGGCHRSWTSRKEAHCARCCAHFASATAADAHWCDGKGAHTPWCDGLHGRPWSPRHADPADVPTLVAADGVWRLAPAQTPQNVPANSPGGGSVQTDPVAS